jgi:hypothetical protein
MNKPHAYLVTGYIKATFEVVAKNADAACMEFERVDLNELKLLQIEATDVEDLGEHYAY